MEIHRSDWPQWMLEEEAKHQRNYLRRIVGWALIAVFVGWATGAYAQPLSRPTQVGELFTAAVKFGGYEAKCMAKHGGCPMPAVLIITIENDNIRGQFDPRNPNFVRINTAEHTIPGTLDFNEVVVHEFVHYLQWLFGELGPQSTCRDLFEIESQAYKAGGAYLAQFGIIKDYSDQLATVAFMAAMCQAGGG